MPRMTHKLSEMVLQRTTEPGSLGDGDGLWFQVKQSKDKDGQPKFGENGKPIVTKSWIYKFTSPTRHKVREMGLGSYPLVSLKLAREKARKEALLLLDGLDPLDVAVAAKIARALEAAKNVLFEKDARDYFDTHKSEWRSEAHRNQWIGSLEQHVFPTLGTIQVAAIDESLVLKTLQPIWASIPETGRRIRERIERILDYSIHAKHRTGPNPARWRGCLEFALTGKQKGAKQKHFPALPHAEIGSLMIKLSALDGRDAAALRFTILTAARSGDTLKALWRDIDMDAATWTIPDHKASEDEPHRTPLSTEAIQILRAIRPHPYKAAIHSYLFVFWLEGDGRAPLGVNAMADVLHERLDMARGTVSVHGMRSAFTDWAYAQPGASPEAIEISLKHAFKGNVRAAYFRGDLLEQRRPLMAGWGRYATTPQEQRGEVVQMVRAAQ